MYSLKDTFGRVKLCAKVDNVSWRFSREFLDTAPGGEYIVKKRKFLEGEVKSVLKKGRYGSPEYTNKHHPLPLEERRWLTKPDPFYPVPVGIGHPKQWEEYCEARIEERREELQTLFAPNRSEWFYAKRRYLFKELHKKIAERQRFLFVLYKSGLSYPWG